MLIKVFDGAVGSIDKAVEASKQRDDTIIALVDQLERRCVSLEERIVQMDRR